MARIELDDVGSYLKIDQLSGLIYDFDTLFSLHPEERGKIVMEPHEVICKRWHQSYGQTPKREDFKSSSYMFAGFDGPGNVALPVLFQPFLNFVNQGQVQPYNQVVAVWYADGEDFIPMHSDYDYGMPKDSEIIVLNLVKSQEVLREFHVKRKAQTIGRAYVQNISVPLFNGRIIRMGGEQMQQNYRHGVPKVPGADPGPRISLTFRKFYC